MQNQNNFNLLRLIFALFVVVSHSYPLSGAPTGDYLQQLTNGQVGFSYLGLYGFFSISGFLVFQSLNNSKNITSYFKKRILRIFPALFVLLFLTVILGYFVYDCDFVSYIHNKSVWTYLPRRLSLVLLQDEIQGVFSHNVYGPPINGSLWSLLYEFAFYVALSVLFFCTSSAQIIILVSWLLALLIGRFFFFTVSTKVNYILEAKLVLEYAPFFFFGSLLAIAKVEQWKYRKPLIVILLLTLVFAAFMNVFHIIMYFVLPELVILIGISSWPIVNMFISKLGDISYGVYIYAFPIQQTLMHFFKLAAIELMIPSILLSCIFGYMSWHLIEVHALKLKQRVLLKS